MYARCYVYPVGGARVKQEEKKNPTSFDWGNHGWLCALDRGGDRERLARLAWHCLPPDSPEVPSTPSCGCSYVLVVRMLLGDLPAYEIPDRA